MRGSGTNAATVKSVGSLVRRSRVGLPGKEGLGEADRAEYRILYSEFCILNSIF